MPSVRYINSYYSYFISSSLSFRSIPNGCFDFLFHCLSANMSLTFYATINLFRYYNNDGWAVRTYWERDDLSKRKGFKFCPKKARSYSILKFKFAENNDYETHTKQ